MAISTLHKLASRVTKTSSLPSRAGSHHPLFRLLRKSCRSNRQTFPIDPDVHKRQVVGLSGQTLLKALSNQALIDPASHRLEDIDAQEWLEKLPPPSHDEQYVLKRSWRNRVLNKHSRLGCQVVVAPEHQGMVVAVPEPKPWDIP
ncbi:UNVERIFIED_CONTAM: hypothetical protein Sradi_0230100 [Sesamum radiatum]|uniref:Uncharacterized protein n=1 Tax=Sesamum radiatum TaxID=300843 RepID=A0AAW2W077_SESRA